MPRKKKDVKAPVTMAAKHSHLVDGSVRSRMTPEQRDKQNTYQKEWDKANTTMIHVKLNHRTDADILAALDKQPSRMGYIKTAIREKIARDNAADEEEN